MRAIRIQRKETILNIGNNGNGNLPKDPLRGEAARSVLYQ